MPHIERSIPHIAEADSLIALVRLITHRESAEIHTITLPRGMGGVDMRITPLSSREGTQRDPSQSSERR
jgi:hypothetical protein